MNGWTDGGLQTLLAEFPLGFGPSELFKYQNILEAD